MNERMFTSKERVDQVIPMLKVAIIFAVAAVCCVQAENPVFYVYTRKTPNIPEQIYDHGRPPIWESSISRDDNTIVLIHGHRGSLRSRFITLVKENIFKFQGPHNVIVVDWEKDASNSYSLASANVPIVARSLQKLLLRMIAFEHLAIDRSIHLVGFGLGAHIAGIAGRWLQAETGFPGYPAVIGRITGLDPSGSGWGSNSQRLTSTDARYVEVIHTDGSGLLSNGIGTAIGHTNFYVNGGSYQPGCLTHSCSHNRAYELFAISMYNENLLGLPCTSTTQMNLNRCSGSPLKLGGLEVMKGGSSNIYRINVRNHPFGAQNL